jgi:hypothetical protein
MSLDGIETSGSSPIIRLDRINKVLVLGGGTVFALRLW